MLTSTDSEPIQIPLSKLKLTFLLIGSIAFVAFGIFLILNPSSFEDSGLYHRPKIEILIVGGACVFFFGAGIIVFIVKLFGNKPGLIIDKDGITINSGVNSNFIEWNNIEKFEIQYISRTKLIIVYLKNTKEFISQLNSFKRKMASFSLNNSGSPISISTGALKCNTDELFALLTKKLSETHLSGQTNLNSFI